MCIFKALHCSPEEQNTGLSLDEFYHFYEVIDFEWNEVDFFFPVVLSQGILTLSGSPLMYLIPCKALQS